MTIVDTNYLVRLFTRIPAAQAKQAVRELEASEPDRIYLPDYVISELVYVLQFHTQLAYSRSQIAKGVRLILEHPAWRCDRQLHTEALSFFESVKLDYVDCLVATEYKLQRVNQVMSFDRRLQKCLG